MRITTAITLLLTLARGSRARDRHPRARTPRRNRSSSGAPPLPCFPRARRWPFSRAIPAAPDSSPFASKMPSGYRIAPHTHPTDENVTVISGTFLVGMGKTFDAKNMMTLHAGGFVTAPAKGAHFAEAQGPTIVQVHAMGPFALTYVNPADAPHAK